MENLNARVYDRDELLTHTLNSEVWGGTLLEADGEGYPRRSRNVYLIAGTTTQAYGGPEEGGWYYDHFREAFRVHAVVASEEELVSVLEKMDALLTAVQGPAYTEIRMGGDTDEYDENWPEYERPRYE